MILAVDDEPLVRTLVATVLQENGFEVLTAECGADAIAIFREHRAEVDLLLSDIVMPGMDGPSLAAALQAERPDLKVLLVSGYCDPEQLAQGFEFLAKPFALHVMLEKVRRMLGARNNELAQRFQSNEIGPPILSRAAVS